VVLSALFVKPLICALCVLMGSNLMLAESVILVKTGNEMMMDKIVRTVHKVNGVVIN